MSRPTPKKGAQQDVAGISKQDYRETLHALQIELVKLQKHFIRCDDKILVLIEGRDAAGKDGVIKRIVQHLSPRETRVVALGKPSDRDRGSWYFQRYVPHLPAVQEFVLFNRSWYNRAGVERVMGFCTEAEHEEFMQTVLGFEHMLVKSGIKLLKYYLDISRNEQRKRLKDRHKDPLKQWKVSPIDAKATKHWADYSRARNEMFARTHNPVTPWTVVRADDKRTARLNLIKDLLSRLHYDDKDESMLHTNPEITFQYQESCVQNGMIAS
ncbi:MAG: polyphosphate kinase 2 [Bradyrhizobium sp.]|uniref:polyphosphate kinase 2 n=1 Tax=Bradyrhizobium sp. TaxID=376 RepID=UPI0029A064E5|nr:polyphosphate kinase 2 [Bradyrhizobium sp.]MDX3966906.1 polyphosphate kinase 2 [Bradyrhizobium sp.]